MTTIEKKYREVLRTSDNPDAYIDMMAFDYSIEMPYSERMMWQEMADMRDADWEDTTGGYESEFVSTFDCTDNL